MKLRLQRARSRKRPRLQRQRDVVDPRTNKPYAKNDHPAATGHKTEHTERSTAHRANDELGANQPAPPQTSRRAPHISSRQAPDVDGHHLFSTLAVSGSPHLNCPRTPAQENACSVTSSGRNKHHGRIGTGFVVAAAWFPARSTATTVIRIGPRVPAGTSQRKLEAGHNSRPTVRPSTLNVQVLTRSLSVAFETDPKRTTSSRRYRRLDRHAGRDRVDPVPEQADPHQAGDCLQRQRAGRPLAEFIRLEHDQNTAPRAGRAEPGTRSPNLESRHPQHALGSAAKLHRPEIDRRRRGARNKQSSRQQHGAAHPGSVRPVDNDPTASPGAGDAYFPPMSRDAPCTDGTSCVLELRGGDRMFTYVGLIQLTAEGERPSPSGCSETSARQQDARAATERSVRVNEHVRAVLVLESVKHA